ncbi:MAG: class I SAM-dependent methyltransferase [Firmicutes bacterium]|nr:class I SAM-dependent methyltransferase [Bacillota bacterium]
MEQYKSILAPNPNLKGLADPNSKEWWENEFRENWRVGIDGVEQTRYFMKRILEVIKFSPGVTVLDWGCAMGQGVDELIKAGYDAEGYDFSETAIETARKMYPDYTFTYVLPEKTYDAVITSNCLEHFAEPVKQAAEILQLSRKYLVILTPYAQTPSDVHPASINENTFPSELNDFKLNHVMILPSKEVSYDGGDQILFVYERDL